MKIILSFMMILTSVLFGVKISQIYLPQNTTSQESTSSRPQSLKFVLKYEDGQVSLFDGDAIIETFSEVNFSTLPSADRESLSEGIIFENLDDAYRLIEDFDG